MASGGHDNAVHLWNVTDSPHLGELAVLRGHQGAVRSVVFNPDGKVLATASTDKTVRLWETDVNRIAARICAVANPSITREEWRYYFPDLAYRPPCR